MRTAKCKFSRNDFAFCISHFSMLKYSAYHNKGNENLNWETYINEKKFPLDHEKYTDIEGKMIVDKIIKYENLNKDLFYIMEKLGIPFQNINSFAKSGYREKKLSVDNVTYEHKKIIYDFFQPSLAYTGYSL